MNTRDEDKDRRLVLRDDLSILSRKDTRLSECVG